MRLKRIIFITLLSLFMSAARAQTIDTCIVSNIHFVVNTSEPIYDSDYQLFIDEQLPYIQEHKQDIKYIKITSSASPEGSYSFNRQLALKRSRFMSELVGGGDINIEAEDYEGLYKLIQQSHEPWKNKILKIISTSNNIKEDLRKSGYWRPLVDHYFPQLRSCTVEVYFSFSEPCMTPCENDTIYIRDFVYIRDTMFIKPNPKAIPILAVKSNLLTDLAFAPTLSAELYTHVWGLSLEAEYMVPWWKNDEIFFYYQIADGIVGIRKYLKNDYTGHWFGLYGHSVLYDLCLSEQNGVQGEGWGFGLSYGYAWRSKRYQRVRFEPYIRIGYFHSNYDTYHAGDPFEGKYYYDWYKRASEFVPRRFNLDYVGPTMLGINISFDAICLRRYQY